MAQHLVSLAAFNFTLTVLPIVERLFYFDVFRSKIPEKLSFPRFFPQKNLLQFQSLLLILKTRGGEKW